MIYLAPEIGARPVRVFLLEANSRPQAGHQEA